MDKEAKVKPDYRRAQIYRHVLVGGDEEVAQPHHQAVGDVLLDIMAVPCDEPGQCKHGSNIWSAEFQKRKREKKNEPSQA